ncbi:unnamed protein product [Thlaspi arvense]|uniref:Uncharacterized protein n=1 Tax=Thlaspi arvense TaxID=13288 RepID=A0AAU9SJB8_THLAR|nr:unnamed protein product [Thlaspi arvense]
MKFKSVTSLLQPSITLSPSISAKASTNKMVNFGPIPPPPPPPPPPPFRFRFIEHQAKIAFDKNKLKRYLENLREQNRESQPVNQDHKITGPDQEQNLENHEHTASKPGTIEVIKGSGTKHDDWVISIRDKLDQADRHNDITSLGKLCIYKVPHYLHQDDKKSYSPQAVALGPYHHGEEQTQSMECHKWRAVNKVLKRTKQGIEVFIDAMIELEEKARACYEGTISLNSYKFTEMLVLDGCFVLEVLRGAASAEGFSKLGYDRNDPIFAIRGSIRSIQRDMIMLENQLPLFVLNRLLEIQLGTRNQSGLVAQLAVQFFDPLMPTGEAVIDNPLTSIGTDPSAELHCLDVFRRSLLLPKLEPMLSGKSWHWHSCAADRSLQQMIPSATDLRDAGFPFRIRKADRFWDIKFKNGYLELPTLVIHDGTKSLFLNLIAFEQCNIDSSNNITSYILFMNNLIKSTKDVTYFDECGIIQHSLGSHSEVVDMFNQLCQEVIVNTDDIYLSQLLLEVYHCYHKNYIMKWNAWKMSVKRKYLTTLKEKYFDNPWAYLPFFAAVILLVLTLSQTYFAAYAYFKPA